MHIIFDISGTVIGSLDSSLRPGIRETLEALRLSGNRVDFWTGGPLEDYRDLLGSLGIEGRVFSKNSPLPFRPDICVDDSPEGWMPGFKYTVDQHISGDMPGAPILVAELVGAGIYGNFYWD